MRSLGPLLVADPVLRRRALYQAAFFAAFTLFWTAVPFELSGPPFLYDGRAIALFALVGALGIAASPLAGRLADRGFGRATTLVSLLAAIGTFGLAYLGSRDVRLLGLAAIGIDATSQACLVVGQRAIFARPPDQRSRTNAAFLASFFVAGALGSALASPLYAGYGWAGVTGAGAAFMLLGLLAFALAEPRLAAPPERA